MLKEAVKKEKERVKNLTPAPTSSSLHTDVPADMPAWVWTTLQSVNADRWESDMELIKQQNQTSQENILKPVQIILHVIFWMIYK